MTVPESELQKQFRINAELRVEIELAQSKLEAITKFIDAQAEDAGLWCEAEYASEAYIQRGLRGCHAFIESVIKDGPRPETTKSSNSVDEMMATPLTDAALTDKIGQ